MRFKEITHAKSRLTHICNLKAFTLAEVLITLAIIGIVAAITIPGLVQNYKKTEYSSKLKKFYSTMQQAIQMSEIEHGPLESWDFQMAVYDEENNYDYAVNDKYSLAWIKKYILPYIKYNKITEGYYTPATETEEAIHESIKIHLSDGSIMHVGLGNCLDITYDVNGDKLPDKNGRDRYWFTFCFDVSATDVKSQGFYPYLYKSVTSRQDALNKCQTNGAYCSVLLQYDNWEFKDDYPFKL